MVELENVTLCAQCMNPALFALVTMLTLTIRRYPSARRRSIQIRREFRYIYIYIYIKNRRNYFNDRRRGLRNNIDTIREMGVRANREGWSAAQRTGMLAQDLATISPGV